MKVSAIIFDLDGTLLDTLADIAHAANDALQMCGFPAHPVDAYRQFVGEGVSVLFLRALPAEARSDDYVARCAGQFPAAYARHWDVRTRPYPGICELLDALEDRNLRLSILSNKPHEFTVKCARELLSGVPFEIVLGQSAEVPRKPDPAGALRICRQLDVPPDEVVYVGDSGVDMQTAIRAGMYPVGVLWGFRPREELVEYGAQKLLEHPRELLGVLDRLAAEP